MCDRGASPRPTRCEFSLHCRSGLPRLVVHFSVGGVVSLRPVWINGRSAAWLVMPGRACRAFLSSAVGGREEFRLAAPGWLVRPAARCQLAFQQVVVTR